MSPPTDIEAVRMPRMASGRGTALLWALTLLLAASSACSWFLGDPPLIELVPILRDLVGR